MNKYQNGEMTNYYGVTPASGQNRGVMTAQAEKRAIAEVQCQMQMAKLFPRDIELSLSKVLVECRRPALAESATYVYERGSSVVTGPSIRLAEALARCMGNMTYGFNVLERSEGKSIIEAYCWDVENNTRTARTFEVRHIRETKSGTTALKSDRDIYEMEANMSARRVRACILAQIPGDIIESAVRECEQTITSNTVMDTEEGRAKIIKKIVDAFAGFGAEQSDLERYINDKYGVENSSEWTAEHIVKLRALYTSLKENIINIGSIWPHLAKENQNETISKQQISDLMKLVGKTGRNGDFLFHLRENGIAKIANIPVSRYDEFTKYAESLMPTESYPKADNNPKPSENEV